jgi:hypothetical protein
MGNEYLGEDKAELLQDNEKDAGSGSEKIGQWHVHKYFTRFLID